MSATTPDQIWTLLREAGPGSTVFLVGAGGCGMSGLGHLLLDLGHRVVGSDLVEGEEVRQLRARGAVIHVGHSAEALRAASPCLVVHTPAVRLDNVELVAAAEARLPIVRRAVVLAAVVARQRGLLVAGMHGKTTTTALLAWALEQLGECPGFAVGWTVPQFDRHARLPGGGGGSGRSGEARGWFAAEVDESDGLLHLFEAEHSIVLNVDAEHLDHYPDMDAICSEFGQFGARTRGKLVFCGDDPRLADIFARHPGAVSYGFHPLATYRVESLAGQRAGGAARFALWHRGGRLGEFSTPLMGAKNLSNCAAVAALLHEIGHAPAAIATAIAGFRGAARRQEQLFADDRCAVYDDYAHHPVEIEATIEAFRGLEPRRILVAFQPHRYTRTEKLFNGFSAAFRGADRLWLMDIYPASEPPIPGVTSGQLAAAIREHGQEVSVAGSALDLCAAVREALKPGDVVLFLGAGGEVTVAARQFAEELRGAAAVVGGGSPAGSLEDLVRALGTSLAPGTVLRRDEPLARKTTLRVGGPADVYVEPVSEEDLAGIVRLCARHGVPWLVLGRGSNLLVRDGGVRGVVISLVHEGFSRLAFEGGEIHCGAGVRLKTLAVEARRHGLTGLEFLEGIPGSVGGAMRMNAGAMGSWMFDVVKRIRFMTAAGEIVERAAGEVTVEYRGCPVLRTHIALGAVLHGQPADPGAIKKRMDDFSQRRWGTQPHEPSAGCIFKNPPAIAAGRLIDELGLKGTSVGAARVSEVHGNFIVNKGGATARDVLALIESVRQRAKAARGIDLETEVEILGEG